jgi:hypothetical protein
MGKFKNVGEPSITLLEEMAEASQVIAKKIRFQGSWDEIPEGKDISRWEELQAEMADVFYQWFRLKEQVQGVTVLTEADFWDGDDSYCE